MLNGEKNTVKADKNNQSAGRFYCDNWYINQEIIINDELFSVKLEGTFGFNINENGDITDEFIHQPLINYPKTPNHLGALHEHKFKVIRQNNNTLNLVYNLEPARLQFRDKAKLIEVEKLEDGTLRKTFEVFCSVIVTGKLEVSKVGDIKIKNFKIFGNDCIDKIARVDKNTPVPSEFRHVLCALTAEVVELGAPEIMKKFGEIRIIGSVICPPKPSE